MLFADTVPHKLIEFLKQHLTSPMKDGEHCYSLVVFNPFMMDEIVCNLKIASLQSQLYIDITRGVRMNFDKFFKNMKVCVSCNPIFCFLIVASSSKYSFISCL
jgi:hypothetical protein